MPSHFLSLPYESFKENGIILNTGERHGFEDFGKTDILYSDFGHLVLLCSC